MLSKNNICCYALTCLLLTAGCVRVAENTKEIAKSFWGSTTRVLESARSDAVASKFSCTVDLCYNEILSVADKYAMVVFSQSRQKGLIVLMSVPNSLDTTEVGVFFEKQDEATTRVDIASLSQDAKLNAAAIVFHELSTKYTEKN